MSQGNAKKQRVDLLRMPVRIESRRVTQLREGMLARMQRPFWPEKMQALWVERSDLRELGPFMEEISRRMDLGGRVHWAGDEEEFSQLMWKTHATGLAVIIRGNDLTDSMQKTLMERASRERFRFVFLTEKDPGDLIGVSWKKEFREMVLTNRFPPVHRRAEDWKALFHAGIAEVSDELKLVSRVAIETGVYEELATHPWSIEDGAIAIMEFGAKVLYTAFAYTHGKLDKITHEHARIALDRPIEVTAAQAREAMPSFTSPSV